MSARGVIARIAGIGRRFPRACVLCAVIATANAAVWAVVTPSFQSPDELVHAGYVQWVAETGTLPPPASGFYGAQDEQAAATGTPWSLVGHPTWSAQQDAILQRTLRGRLGRTNVQSAGYESNEPPLYYAAEAIPYQLFYGSTYFSRLLAMRLFSALFAGLTVAGIFLFVRELLPSWPWTWTVSGLVCAFQPELGFISGSVDNDALLYATGAVLFWLVARILRRGFTWRRAAAIGLVAIAGALTKPSAYGLLPGAALALMIAAIRTERARGRSSLRGAGQAILVSSLVAAILVGWYRLVARGSAPSGPSTGLPGGLAGDSGFLTASAIREQLSYLWQFYLPRLPFMKPQFTLYPLWYVDFQGFIGHFGWNEFGFAGWVITAAAAIFAALAALAGSALVRARHAFRKRWAELGCYAIMVMGLLAVIGITGYRYRQVTSTSFEQARYTFPLLALYGALIALALYGAPRRWAKPLGVLLVMLAIAHSTFALVITVRHYYA